jgi:hypothetical protein
LLADALEARAEGETEEARKRWDKVADYVWRHEDSYQPVFDVYLFVQTLQKMFQDKRKTNFGGEVV